ncbi:hypothetical protein FB451DRAFT_1191835 [Mycena latifolia]|nr:hypothetical protein FB451DRAFT_1191835 [Mycena latifolia]
MFDAADDLSQPEIKAYRNFAFPAPLGDSAHDPTFSVDNAAHWMTSHGYQLYLGHDDHAIPFGQWLSADASTKQLKAYRRYMLSDEYLAHPFFNLENPDNWINPVPFQAYMELYHGPFGDYRDSHSSRAPSRSDLWGGPPAPVKVPKVEHPPSPAISAPGGAIPSTSAHKRRNKGKGKENIRITRELTVDEIVEVSEVPSTWNIPRRPTAYMVDLSGLRELLKTHTGKQQSLDAFIRSEDQESWGGSTGHSKGDVFVYNLTSDPTQKIFCRRCHFTCNGVETCEFIDPTLFAGCERYEPDYEAMRGLWRHELDANEEEAALSHGPVSRFYAMTMNSKCKIECAGVPTLIRLSKGPSAHGKLFFVGCSDWSRAQQYDHRYWPIHANVDVEVLRFVMENHGQLPPGEAISENATCVLTVHPRVGLKNCLNTVHSHKAFVVLRTPHNHPVHPTTKPSANDRTTLTKAVQAAGLTGLTAQKLLNAPSTSTIYGGRLSESSPAFTDKRRLRDFISNEKKKDHPLGMGWEGVLHQLNTREIRLDNSDRYIHTVMSKNGFRLVVTMHPQIAMFIHRILSLNIDYTFKLIQLEGLTFRSLYCDTATGEAFAQLFTELFDTIRLLTGQPLKLAPFFPDAKCRIVMLDGEVPQAQGFATFLQIQRPRDKRHFHSGCRRTAQELPQDLHIDELPVHIPKSTIARLKSIMGLSTQTEIDEWHEFCTQQTDEKIKYWYAHKLANPWVLPSVNKFLSNIKPADWDITPNHSNYVETAHAARNAETSVGVGLLTAILQAQERDNIKAKEMARIELDAVMPHRWNGSFEREKLSVQRKVWTMRKTAVRNDQLTSYDTLKAERDLGTEDNKRSLERQKALDTEIKGLQNEMKIDPHRSDLPKQVNELRRDVEEEKAGRREWIIHRAETAGRRPTARSSGEDDSTPDLSADGAEVDFHRIEDGSVPLEPAQEINQVNLEPIFQRLDYISPALHYVSHEMGMAKKNDFSADLTAFEQNMFSSSSNQLDSAFNMEEFLGSEFSMDDGSGLPIPPPPAASSPSSTELQEASAASTDLELPIATHDIDLDLSEKNILSGKRQRTISARAAGVDALKKPRSSQFGVIQYNDHFCPPSQFGS